MSGKIRNVAMDESHFTTSSFEGPQRESQRIVHHPLRSNLVAGKILAADVMVRLATLPEQIQSEERLKVIADFRFLREGKAAANSKNELCEQNILLSPRFYCHSI